MILKERLGDVVHNVANDIFEVVRTMDIRVNFRSELALQDHLKFSLFID